MYGGVLGQACFNRPQGGIYNSTGSDLNWGLSYNETTGMIYATDGNRQQDTQGYYQFSVAEYEASIANGTCIDPIVTNVGGPTSSSGLVVGDNLLPIPGGNWEMNGITSDNDGNVYIAHRVTNPRTTEILKYDSNGGFLGVSAQSNTDYANARGIVWSELTNRIYLASEIVDTDVDCISAFDATTLAYLGTAAGNPTGISLEGAAKSIGIVKECCPINNTQVIDTTLCEVSGGEVLFLANLIKCGGVICEGLWQDEPTNFGVLFDPCDNSITIDPTATSACGKFVLESDGANANAQCGAFRIEVNIQVLSNPTVTLIPDATICAGESINLYGILDTEGDPNYQWQQSTTSCIAGFTDIDGATDSTYMATPIDTTYFRLITSTAGICASGTCADTSACVSIYPTELPTATVADVLKCTSNSETIEVMPSGGTGPYTYTWSGPFISDPGNVASFTATSTGIYSVTVMDNEGCTITSSGELTFQSKVCLPATFSIRRGSRN